MYAVCKEGGYSYSRKGGTLLQSVNPTPFGCEGGARMFYQVTGIHLQQNYLMLEPRTITGVEI
jgi:hypothetical protein